MRLQILHVPDCPNTAVLAARLEEVLAARADFALEQLVVADQDEAAGLGMTGSPTLLVDGTDPFATPGTPATMSCRLYADETGAVTGAPSLVQLRAVLAGHRLGTAPREARTSVGWRAAGTGSRQAALPPSLRRLHQAVLRHFLGTGDAPDRAWMTEQARGLGLDVDAAIRQLTAADLVHVDRAGRVTVAYPFSGVTSGHRVQVAGAPAVWAMCAIDALGIPQMADRDATITAADPVTGEPVTVGAHAGPWTWRPESTVVLIAQTGHGGPSAHLHLRARQLLPPRRACPRLSRRAPRAHRTSGRPGDGGRARLRGVRRTVAQPGMTRAAQCASVAGPACSRAGYAVGRAGSGQPSAEPAQRPADDRCVVPAAPDHELTRGPQLIARASRRRRAARVLAGTGLLVQVVRAGQAHRGLGMIAEPHQIRLRVAGAATPALQRLGGIGLARGRSARHGPRPPSAIRSCGWRVSPRPAAGIKAMFPQ
jgi:hypothetical protein